MKEILKLRSLEPGLEMNIVIILSMYSFKEKVMEREGLSENRKLLYVMGKHSHSNQ